MRIEKILAGDFVFVEFKTYNGIEWVNMVVKESHSNYKILKCVHKNDKHKLKDTETINNVNITLQDEVGVEVLRGFTLSRLDSLKEELFVLTDEGSNYVSDVSIGNRININTGMEVTVMNNEDTIKAKVIKVEEDSIIIQFPYSKDHCMYNRGILIKVEDNGKAMMLCGDMEQYDVLHDGTVEAVCIIQDMDSDIREYVGDINRSVQSRVR